MKRKVFSGFLECVVDDKGPLAFAVLTPIDGERFGQKVPLYMGFSCLALVKGMVGRFVDVTNETRGFLFDKEFTQTVSSADNSSSCTMSYSEVRRKDKLNDDYLHPERFFNHVV